MYNTYNYIQRKLYTRNQSNIRIGTYKKAQHPKGGLRCHIGQPNSLNATQIDDEHLALSSILASMKNMPCNSFNQIRQVIGTHHTLHVIEIWMLVNNKYHNTSPLKMKMKTKM